MAWNTSTSYTAASAWGADEANGVGLDLRTWGGPVDAAGNNLSNLGVLTFHASGYVASSVRAYAANVEVKLDTPSGDPRLTFALGGVDKWSWYHNRTTGTMGLYDWNSAAYRLIVKADGSFGVGTDAPTVSGTGKLHHAGDTARIVGTTRTPVSAADTGNVGEVCADASYLYVCIGANTWRRIAHASW